MEEKLLDERVSIRKVDYAMMSVGLGIAIHMAYGNRRIEKDAINQIIAFVTDVAREQISKNPELIQQCIDDYFSRPPEVDFVIGFYE